MPRVRYTYNASYARCYAHRDDHPSLRSATHAFCAASLFARARICYPVSRDRYPFLTSAEFLVIRDTLPLCWTKRKHDATRATSESLIARTLPSSLPSRAPSSFERSTSHPIEEVPDGKEAATFSRLDERGDGLHLDPGNPSRRVALIDGFEFSLRVL